MTLSVVIPCYNAEATLAYQLDALSKQEYSQPWEIVVADNGSTDSSWKIAEAFARRLPNLQLIDASKRKGAAFARNTAIMASFGDSLVLCDADDVVGENWVAVMGAALQHQDFVACRIDLARLNPPWVGNHPQGSSLQALWYPPFVQHAGSGTMGFKRIVFNSVGGFREDMPYLEDTDFSIRAQQQGFKLSFVPDTCVHVRLRVNLRSHFLQALKYSEYNVLLARLYWTPGAPVLIYWRRFIVCWARLTLHIPAFTHSKGRYAWMYMLGRQIGRLQGVVRYGGVPV